MIKIQGAKNGVLKGSIITAKMYNSSKASAKTTKVTLKVHGMNGERFNMSR